VSYVIASYAIVLGSLIVYGIFLRRSRRLLRKALKEGRNRDRS